MNPREATLSIEDHVASDLEAILSYSRPQQTAENVFVLIHNVEICQMCCAQNVQPYRMAQALRKLSCACSLEIGFEQHRHLVRTSTAAYVNRSSMYKC